MGDEADALIDAGLMGDDEFDEEYDFYANQNTISGQADKYFRETATWQPKGKPAMLIMDMTDDHLNNAMALFERRGQTGSVLYRNLLREKTYRNLIKENKDGQARGRVRLHQ